MLNFSAFKFLKNKDFYEVIPIEETGGQTYILTDLGKNDSKIMDSYYEYLIASYYDDFGGTDLETIKDAITKFYINKGLTNKMAEIKTDQWVTETKNWFNKHKNDK